MTTMAAGQVFVARQPILTASQRVAAYELLFRQHSTAGGAVIDVPLQATAEALTRSLLTIGLDELTGGRPSFVNFPREALFHEMASQLPPQLVIEVLEDVGADDDVVAACADLRRRGFRIALDDYCFEPEREPLLAVADVIKIDLTLVDLNAPETADRLRALRRRGVQLLAEKVELPSEFERAKALGFELFQGYFWGRPEVVAGRQLPPSARTYLRLVNELGRAEFDIANAKELVKSDPALSQALLRYINSAQFRWMSPIDSVHRAMAMLGRDEMRRWAAMLALITTFDGLSPEVVTTAVARGRFCELLAPTVGAEQHANDLFFAGLFSMADLMMGVPIEDALRSIPMDEVSRQAILAPESEFGRVLGAATAYQRADWPEYVDLAARAGIDAGRGADAYLEAVRWTDHLLHG